MVSALPIRDGLKDRLDNEIELLATIGWDFAATADLGQTLHNAIQRTLEHLDAEAGSIFLLDDTAQFLECKACAGPLDITGLKLESGHGIVGRTVATNRLQMVLDVAQDSGFNAFVDTRTGFVTRSILCAPLQIRGTPLGALEVINKKSADGLFSPSDANLLTALAALAALAIHNAHMAAALVEQERMKKELELAGEIQRSLLPQAPADNFPVHGLNLPALEVSGDFYHFFELPDGRICFCLGDVSGKGMNASLLMAKTISLFHCLAKTMLEPGTLLAAINDELAETASHGMFVTMVAGIYDPAQQQAVFANAGHQPPLLRDLSGGFREFEALEPPLGILPGMVFSERTLALEGGCLYVFSDGLTEGRLEDGAQLGIAGVRDLIGTLAPLSPPQRLEGLVDRLRQAGTALHDDITVLVVGSQADELRLHAQPEQLPAVRAWVREAAKRTGCGEELAENLVLAVNEACMNVIQHGYGYGFGEGKEMLLRARREQGTLVFELLDEAPPVRPEEIQPRPLDEIRPGGLGVHFMRSIMDEVTFVEPPAGYGNLLRMVKRL